MALPSRAAAVRGDDYQYAAGWYWVCRLLSEPDIATVSIEDAGGGYFDDIVVRRRHGPDTFWQVKSSNYGHVVINTEWLTTAEAPRGKSPLQHYHGTWTRLREAGKPFELALVTNRSYDPTDHIIGRLRDLKSEKINVEVLRAARTRSDIAKTHRKWCEHLGIDLNELCEFLIDVTWRSGGPQQQWEQQAASLMRNVGLRTDQQALIVGRDIVRGWVTDGAGPQDRQAIRSQVATTDLLARSGTLVLAVHAIDKAPNPYQPHVEVDFVHLYEGDEPFARVRLRRQEDWAEVVSPGLRAAAAELEQYGTRRAHITASMRLPLWFAVGRALPDVRGWVLSLDQRGDEWVTNANAQQVTPTLITDELIGQGKDIAVGLALTHDLTDDLVGWIRETELSVNRLLVLGPDSTPGPQSVKSAEWATGWTRAARESIRSACRTTKAPQVHLFMAAPAGIALMIGHSWNMLPPTMVYEHTRFGYTPTLEIAG